MTQTKFSFLKVDGEKIVDENGDNVILKGAGLGGWMKYVFFLSTTYKPSHDSVHCISWLILTIGSYHTHP